MTASKNDLDGFQKDKALRSTERRIRTKAINYRTNTNADNFCSRWYVITEMSFKRLGVRWYRMLAW